MNKTISSCVLGVILACWTAAICRADEPVTFSEIHGGLIVQLGADMTGEAIRLAGTGRYVVHVLDPDPERVKKARATLKASGLYGLVFAEVMTDPARLPYSENVVNGVYVRSSGKVSLAEIFRVMTPLGVFEGSREARFDVKPLEKAGFGTILAEADRSVSARKPWPKNMDTWSHPRHAADGNAVSLDTAVGPPARVRWVAAAMAEVEGLITDGGRNFYGGVLARDSFNGLRLWHRDLAQGKLNDPSFNLPRLSYKRARPVASAKYLFAYVRGKVTALDAATGKVVQEYQGTEASIELIQHLDVVLVGGSRSVRAFSTETGKQLWERKAGDARNLAAESKTVSYISGRPKRGEPVEAFALDLYSGQLKWNRTDFSWLPKVYRTVMHEGQVVYEVSSLNDHNLGNAIHLLDTETGRLTWEKKFSPGMNHKRQARAMFSGDDLWLLHGGRENTAPRKNGKVKETKVPVQVSALDPKTGKVLKTHSAGLAHCFPPVATPKYVFAGVLDLTNMETGEVEVNPITKANCSREGGWVPANGLIYTTPKHCTCWPMLRGFVAMASASPDPRNPVGKPIDKIRFPLVRGKVSADPGAAKAAADDWPTYRGDRWRSGSSGSAGPLALDTRWGTKLADSTALPDGPILFDWEENPYIKGPISAPVISGGRVFVARGDAHEVIALSAGDGKELWRYTARGRVDTPPTIYRGLALFGCHAGYVYALRVDSGELAWEFRAAPVDERIVAYGQVESPWPVPGSVLVRKDTAYFVAGRQQLADGGVLVFAVDPLSGEKRWVHRLDHMPQKGDPTGKNPYKGFYENSGLEFDPVDIIHEEGEGIAMSRWIISSAGKLVSVDEWNAFARLDTGGGAVWVPRGSWTYGARHQDRFKGEAPRRPLVVFRDGKVYGELNGSTDIFRRDFDAAALKKFNGKWITGWQAGRDARGGKKPFRTHRVAAGSKWTVDVFTPAGKKPKAVKYGTQLYNDIHAMALAASGRLYAVHKDGRLKVLDTKKGSLLTARKVPPPMWDGLAIASGRVFLSTLSGEVLCLE